MCVYTYIFFVSIHMFNGAHGKIHESTTTLVVSKGDGSDCRPSSSNDAGGGIRHRCRVQCQVAKLPCLRHPACLLPPFPFSLHARLISKP